MCLQWFPNTAPWTTKALRAFSGFFTLKFRAGLKFCFNLRLFITILHRYLLLCQYHQIPLDFKNLIFVVLLHEHDFYQNWNLIFFLFSFCRRCPSTSKKLPFSSSPVFGSSQFYFDILLITNKLSRGEICVANFIPPCEWCESG